MKNKGREEYREMESRSEYEPKYKERKVEELARLKAESQFLDTIKFKLLDYFNDKMELLAFREFLPPIENKFFYQEGNDTILPIMTSLTRDDDKNRRFVQQIIIYLGNLEIPVVKTDYNGEYMLAFPGRIVDDQWIVNKFS